MRVQINSIRNDGDVVVVSGIYETMSRTVIFVYRSGMYSKKQRFLGVKFYRNMVDMMRQNDCELLSDTDRYHVSDIAEESIKNERRARRVS